MHPPRWAVGALISCVGAVACSGDGGADDRSPAPVPTGAAIQLPAPRTEGALYPLEVYAATPDGLIHYVPEGHRARTAATADLRAQLSEAAGGQAAVADAAVVLVITAVPARTEARYGERADRYVRLEAGHVAQNVLLEAVALGLGGVPIGAFSDEDVGRVLALPSGEVPLYLLPVGHPAEDG